MSLFSGSSRNRNYSNRNYGSNHYQRNGFIGNLLNIFSSGSNPHRNQYNPPQCAPLYPQQPLNQNSLKLIVCTKCGAGTPAGSKFCLECGQRVNMVATCRNCGEPLPANSKFCLQCGTRVED